MEDFKQQAKEYFETFTLYDLWIIVKNITKFIIKTTALCCMFLIMFVCFIFIHSLFSKGEPFPLPNIMTHDPIFTSGVMLIFIALCRAFILVWATVKVFQNILKIFCTRLTTVDIIFCLLLPTLFFLNTNNVLADYCMFGLIGILVIKKVLSDPLLYVRGGGTYYEPTTNYTPTNTTYEQPKQETHTYSYTPTPQPFVEQKEPVTIQYAYQWHDKAVNVVTSKTNFVLPGILISQTGNTVVVKPYETAKVVYIYDSEGNVIGHRPIM